ncbi:type II toxin-antitoxin system PemK/MazF family toxin [Klebsiella pneumoniae]|uniref:type II toxin-antitoxin system PemK/MazF family toxin n=1 Tax=Klebsiella pneumoniae TaxID=573 RepID=UPI002731F7CC|nr:type II toxin-antitoxin system PemK/MazF family toxin [Klebsiella pneumoniae]MDP1129370.1 type II toxin-antitoxin system PemK/MazF family toxin [Klebsiella pneumoniae]MDP1490313.1 type II toxin-antitoxin system PemK/MazF family toxin [Klebsiella pneumoniae]
MGLKFQPAVRSVLMCDFAGMVVPEIVKKRPIVVVARNRHHNQLGTVVPISTTAPIQIRDCHHELSVNPIPGNEHIACWVKCDMVMTVSLARLDRIKIRTLEGRSYIVPQISTQEFELIRNGILHGMGMPHLIR